MDENYIVKKSNHFIMNSSYDLSLEEQKIVLTLASMVQPNDEEFKPYKFKIADFMKLIGVEDKSKYSEIPKITKALMKKVLEIQEENGLLQVAWLSSVRYEKGSGMVTLRFSPDLKPYMLKLNGLFTRYKLANILSMKSKYSPRIYELLKCNEFKKQKYIELEVEELRKLLKAETIYPKYNDFKRYIIVRTQKELKKVSDLSFEFEEIKTGRKITSIKFYIKSNRPKEVVAPSDEVCVTSEGNSPSKDKKPSKTILRGIKAIFKEDINDNEATWLFNTAKGDINIIKEKYKLAESVSKIDNIVGWVRQAIKENYQAPKRKNKTDNFNNFEQRPFDETLEYRLLGWDKRHDLNGEEYEQGTIQAE
jgi:plasmid replication initiation protein